MYARLQDTIMKKLPRLGKAAPLGSNVVRFHFLGVKLKWNFGKDSKLECSATTTTQTG